jgi:group II intron reverse transcriptase/maturase
MRNADTVLGLLRERGKRGLPLERVYKLLFNPALYLRAYGRIAKNHGALTPGATLETADGMSLVKIEAIIDAVRHERYRWTPARRVYIEKKGSTKKRPLGLPTWSDKLLQEVIRSILEAYYEPQFSDRSHGFRAGRGCHTALSEVYYNWHGTAWFIEGDISACFDRLSHDVLVNTLAEKIHDGRFLHLISELLKAGYLEEWTFNATLSGVPQGGVVSPICSNVYLDRLDKFVEQTLIPAYTHGTRRRNYPEYKRVHKRMWALAKAGRKQEAKVLRRTLQRLPARDPLDPDYRRLRYVRYADDWLLGFCGPRAEAEAIKRQLGEFLREELKLDLSETKTLITHARSQAAHFLGYEVVVLDNDTSRDQHGHRNINGQIGLKVPVEAIRHKCQAYSRHGKPIHRTERINDSDFSVVAQYQLEYRGTVEYYRLAFNLHRLSRLKGVMEQSLAKTLARKFRTSVTKVYRRYRATHQVDGRTYKTLQVTVERGEGRRPLVARWGGVPLKWRMTAALDDQPPRAWSTRSELLDRLLAGTCELCGSQEAVEVHHIRKLADLRHKGQGQKPAWVRHMAARRRKTLIVCRKHHEDIQYGRCSWRTVAKADTGELGARKRGTPSSEGGRRKRTA